MLGKAAERNRPNLWLSSRAALSAFILFVLLTLISDGPDVALALYALVAVPVGSIPLLLFAILGEGQRFSKFSMFVVYLVVSATLIAYNQAVRTTVRWVVWSQQYKAEVRSQPTPFDGQLKHIEWDGWGWAGMDTTVYLVFDPTDSLAATVKNRSSGKFAGIPCEVYRARPLEPQWYSAQFYTDDEWRRCN